MRAPTHEELEAESKLLAPFEEKIQALGPSTLFAYFEKHGWAQRNPTEAWFFWVAPNGEEFAFPIIHDRLPSHLEIQRFWVRKALVLLTWVEKRTVEQILQELLDG